MELNPQQQEAVNTIEGPLLVLAGAGSGKTRIVTMRIAHLLEIGVPADEILALTFTNKAAEEMRSRIRKLSSQNILASTFHSLCARILREAIAPLGFTSDFTIYDQKDSEQLIKSCLEMLGYALEKGLVRSLQTAISNAKNDMLTPQDLANTPEDKVLTEVYIAYQQKLKEYNALDFDDLLFHVVTLFTKHPEVLEIYQNRWSFILIDEYQDTNVAQYTITQKLAEKHNNLCVVGDPDQSIYSWRGANINNILNFSSDYPGAKTIKLEQNYRSTSHILRAANSVIARNEERYEKNLFSDLGDGEKPQIYFARGDREEAQYVVEALLHFHKHKNLSLNDIVIFYRTNAQSRSFEDLLLKYNLPYTIIGGISFYQRREIKDILALLKLVLSSSDFLSFVRTINLPRRGFGAKTLALMQEAAEQEAKPILSLCDEMRRGMRKASKKQVQGLHDYLTTIEHLRDLVSQNARLEDIVIEAVERSQYLSYLQEDPDTFSDRKENVDALIAKAAEWEDGTHLRDFLEELSLKASADDANAHQETVKLMTIHNGKGLEFPLVFVVGLEEELFPHINSKDDPHRLEEERRLFYVAMTRAKRHLFLTGSSMRMLWGVRKVMTPSRFIDELPREHVTFLNKVEEMEVSEEEGEFRIGDIVYHANFGKGSIKKSYSTSMGTTYDVYFFEDNITRSLVAKFAKLQLN